jgi:hypothetical protein
MNLTPSAGEVRADDRSAIDASEPEVLAFRPSC